MIQINHRISAFTIFTVPPKGKWFPSNAMNGMMVLGKISLNALAIPAVSAKTPNEGTGNNNEECERKPWHVTVRKVRHEINIHPFRRISIERACASNPSARASNKPASAQWRKSASAKLTMEVRRIKVSAPIPDHIRAVPPVGNV